MMTSPCLSRLVRESRGERGAALVTALVLMLAMLTLTVALLNSGSDEVQVAANHLRATQALLLAEAGLEAALTTLRKNPDLFETAPANFTALNVASPVAAFGAADTYNVQYKRAGSNTAVTVVATGTGAASSAKTLRATISIGYTTAYAMTAGRDIDFKSGGNQQFLGDCGSAFANGDLKATGYHGTVDGTLDAHGTRLVTPGQPGADGLPAQPMPPIVPADFLKDAMASLPANTVFQMKADGRVLDGNNNLITTLSAGQTFRYFVYTPLIPAKPGKKGRPATPATWTLAGNIASPGTYYFEGNVVVAGSPGTAASPWRATLMANDDIAITGSPTTIASMPDVLLVAGDDISINSADIGDESGGGDNSGVIAAHGNLYLSGSTKINGYVVVEGAAELARNVTFNFDCGNLISPIPGTIKMTHTWGL